MSAGRAALLLLAVLLALAAAFDMRERRLPNPLAALLAMSGACYACAVGGVSSLARNALAALAVAGLLTCFELAWRRLRGEPGQGMGDIKALGALMLASPSLAVAGYALGMAALALAGATTGHRALSFLPFLAGGTALAAVLSQAVA